MRDSAELDFSDAFPWLREGEGWDIPKMEAKWASGDHVLDIVDDCHVEPTPKEIADEKHDSLPQCSRDALSACRYARDHSLRVVLCYRSASTDRISVRYGIVLEVEPDRILLDQDLPESGLRTLLASGMGLVRLVRSAGRQA